MKVIGVTGTNGKTTISWFLREVLTAAGYNVGMIGTLTGRLTTPSPWELSKIFDDFRKDKKDFVIMEVSSHGIHQDRIKGIYYHAKLLTNITQDHLDYHKSLREYRKVKLGWMKRGDGIKIYPKDYLKEKIDFVHPFIGGFNERNIKAVLAVTKALNIDQNEVVKAFKKMSQVPGRFENIAAGQPFNIVVDYAHTPDGIKNIMLAVVELRKRLRKNKTSKKIKIITVFGCGGDRDRGKRPKMGYLACKYSDVAVVTSDNPRSESPQDIIDEILVGMKGCRRRKKEIIVEEDRHKAIEIALKKASKNDIVVVAGKGHETYQVVGKKRSHFDDREEIRKVLKKMGYKKK